MNRMLGHKQGDDDRFIAGVLQYLISEAAKCVQRGARWQAECNRVATANMLWQNGCYL